ncbi:MAG: hypothetical protein HY608_01140 [Planctomycetes bacterium]|nr:hypothetical protein [Planctomycetota bacterium]
MTTAGKMGTVPIFLALAACLSAGCAPSREEPDWIRGGAWEEAGDVIAVGVGTGPTDGEACEQALAAARVELARMQETRVRAETRDFIRAIRSEHQGNATVMEEQQIVSRVATEARSTIGRTAVVPPYHLDRDGSGRAGSVHRAFVRVRVEKRLLYPGQRLQGLIAGMGEGEARARGLAALAQEYEGEGLFTWADLSLRMAVSQSGAPSSVILQYAWFLKNRGDDPGAYRWARTLAGDDAASDEERQGASRIIAAIESDLVAVERTLEEIDRLAVARADPAILRVTRSGDHPSRASFVVEVRGPPRTLAFLWLDSDGLSWLTVEGAREPFAGSRTLDFEVSPEGLPATLYVWAVSDPGPLEGLLSHMTGRVIRQDGEATDEEKLLARSLLHALRLCETPGRSPAASRVTVR